MKRVYSFRGLIAVVFCLFLTAGCGGNTEKEIQDWSVAMQRRLLARED